MTKPVSMRIERLEFNKVEITWKPSDRAPEIVSDGERFKIELETKSFGARRMLSDALVSDAPIIINGNAFKVLASAICCGQRETDAFWINKSTK